MRWLAATVGLLAVSLALIAGIYVRDRNPSQWLPPQRNVAGYDAETILLDLRCGHLCSYTLLGNPRRNHWVARIAMLGATVDCFDIDVTSFDITGTQGISGAHVVRCGSIAPGPVG
jgi:hypothetical protein